MKNITQILAAIFFVAIISACNTKAKEQTSKIESACCSDDSKATSESCCSEKKSETKSCCATEAVADSEVQAYYFHATRRCATCEAVEKVTAETIEEDFKGKVAFVSINREENKENPLLEKYKVDGQTLILVKGDKVENLTTTAFLNARSNPEKFKEKLKSSINTLLN